MDDDLPKKVITPHEADSAPSGSAQADDEQADNEQAGDRDDADAPAAAELAPETGTT